MKLLKPISCLFIVFIATLTTVDHAWADDVEDCFTLAAQQAFPSCLQAAENGDDQAQDMVGDMYMYGRGIEKDIALAISWYHKAANQGFALSQLSLGKFYGDPRNKQRNYAKALKWLRKAVKQDNAKAQLYLGRMYQLGNGVRINAKRAWEWFYKSGLTSIKDGDITGARIVLLLMQTLPKSTTSFANKLEEKIKESEQD